MTIQTNLIENLLVFLNYMELEAVRKSIVSFIKTEVHNRGTNGAVIGVSGGIDSAVMVALAAEALGNEHVFGLILPDSDITPISDVIDATNLCIKLNIEFRKIYINEPKASFQKILDETENRLLQGNLVARIRMCIMYYYSGLLKKLVLGTSNKTELELGYFTKYGDGGADLLPLGDLYKTNVFELARHLNIPENITNKKSSARLWPGQVTEEELGVSFPLLDGILKRINELYCAFDSKKVFDLDEKIIKDLAEDFPSIDLDSIRGVYKLSRLNRHKVTPPPVCKL
jgi:NAD+ synthase